jgi:phosphohistidine phosphatase
MAQLTNAVAGLDLPITIVKRTNYMLQLILMRHAKSSWSDRKRDDFERPLSKRGKEAASRIGRTLAERGLLPKLILCSTARRTRETLGLALDAMASNPRVDYDDKLYTFDDGTSYLNAIAKQKDVTPLMLVGHNPSIQNLALRLAVTGDVSSLQRMQRKFPTAAVAVIAFTADSWSKLPTKNFAEGELKFFITPKMLE